MFPHISRSPVLGLRLLAELRATTLAHSVPRTLQQARQEGSGTMGGSDKMARVANVLVNALVERQQNNDDGDVTIGEERRVPFWYTRVRRIRDIIPPSDV